MRFQVLFAIGLIAAASATPLLDKKQASSLKVIDIPADLFADASENTETVKAPEEAPPAAVAAAPVVEVPEEKVPVDEVPLAQEQVPVPPPKEVSIVASGEDVATATSSESADEKKNESGETEDIDRPSLFGFRLPTIVVMRRPAAPVFDDPFPFFPFFNFNRRPAPSFTEPIPPRRVETREGLRPLSAAASPSEPRPVSTDGSGGIGDLMFNMRQQMDSLFSGLFAPNPNAGFYPNRQFFPRPFFPSIPSDSSAEDSVDFSKLPDNYKNSTSETKVIDGQVVQVNKTVHRISGNNSNGFFQFSVIKIRPENPEAELQPEVVASPPAAIGTPEVEKVPEPIGSEVTTLKAEREVEISNPSLNEVDEEKKVSTESRPGAGIDEGLL